MFEKLNIIHQYNNQVTIDFRLQLLNIFLEEKRWIHANPTLYSTGKYKNKYKAYYVEDHELVNDFFEAMLDQRKFVILQGKRGSGKTSFLNYFLNRKTRDLNDKGLTWVRIDTTKIYKNRVSFTKGIDFEIYLYAQLLFVYFRYKGRSQNNTCVTDFRCPQNNTFQLESCDEIFKNIELKELIKENQELIDMHDKAEGNALKTSHYNNSYEGKCFDCNELGKVLYREVADKLIVIIDGIDNINYNSSIKHAVWGDLEKFLNQIKDTNPPHKLILSLRTENYTILSTKLKYLDIDALRGQVNIGKNAPHFFDIRPIPLKKIITKFKDSLMEVDISDYTENDYLETLQDIFEIYQKYLLGKLKQIKTDLLPQEYIKIQRVIDMKLKGLQREQVEEKLENLDMVYDTSLALSIKKSGYPLIEKLEKAMRFLLAEERKHDNESFVARLRHQTIHNYFEFTTIFEKVLRASLKKRIDIYHNEINNDSLIADIFNGDLRELFILSYKSYAFLINYANKRDKEIGSFPDISSYAKGRDLLIVRAAFQNGNHYYGSRDDIIFYPPYRNINFINLFNLLDNNRQATPPLAILYLLRYLYDREKSDKQIGDMFKSADYGIPTTEMLNEFLEFGYIKAIKAEDSSEIHYTATPKGKNILEYSLTDLSVIQSYIYTGLINTEHKAYYRIWHDDNYASQILFNILLYWHELITQEKELKALRESMDVELTLIPNSAKESYIKLSRSFPEKYTLNDIDAYTKQNKSLAKSLKELHRQITFEGADYDKLYDSSHRKEIASHLELDEKIIYALSYLGKNSQEIIDDAKLHDFVFGNVDLDKEKERLQTIEMALANPNYWSNRGGLIKKLEKLKIYYMEE